MRFRILDFKEEDADKITDLCAHIYNILVPDKFDFKQYESKFPNIRIEFEKNTRSQLTNAYIHFVDYGKPIGVEGGYVYVESKFNLFSKDSKRIRVSGIEIDGVIEDIMELI